MEDMDAAYYHPPPASHYAYYPPPPPQATGAPLPPPPQHHHLPPPYPHGPHHLPHFGGGYEAHDGDVRTLFVAGLPDDTKHREVYNLFREFPGYQSCQLRCSGHSSQAFAFAVFMDQQSAVAAMHALNGMVFDLERKSTLHIDLAKSNSRGKRHRTDDVIPYSSDKKVRESVVYSRGFPDSGFGSNIHMPGMGNTPYSTNDYPSTQSHGHYAYEAVNYAEPHKTSSSTPYVPQNTIPCATLFVANLGPTCTEKELTQVFSRCRGFLKLKMQHKKGVPVAFVDFQDIPCSAGALNHLQGTFLYSSVGEGMRLEYAKARMGLRRRERGA